jgi:hypothetical protein
MLERRLPAYPLPMHAETPSSWIERTSCFYGCDFDHWIAPLLFELDESGRGRVDLDANESVRHLLERWTGLPLSQIPAACTVSHSLLPKTARLTFCDRCWDDDVRIGSQPHIRRDWTNWATVHCSSHRTFLSARYGNLDKRNELVSWQDVWASGAGWRAALNLQRRSEYSGSGWYKPFNTDHWDETMRDLILDTISEFGRADIPKLLGRILDSAKLIYKSGGLPTPIDGRIARMSESEMPATGDGIPLLLENRIQVLRLAAEILRFLRRGTPVDPAFRDIVLSKKADIVSALARFRRSSRAHKQGQQPRERVQQI